MQNRINRGAALVTIGLAGTAAAVVVVIVIGHLSRDVLQLLMIITGALSASSLSLIPQILIQPTAVGPRSAGLRAIGFDEMKVRTDLKGAMEGGFVVVPTYPPPADRWEPSVEGLLAQDPPLALAKVRLDLEREVRRIAFEGEAMPWDQSANLSRILEKVENRIELPPQTFVAIRDIISACDGAIHGQPVSIETASKIVDAATAVMQIVARR